MSVLSAIALLVACNGGAQPSSSQPTESWTATDGGGTSDSGAGGTTDGGGTDGGTTDSGSGGATDSGSGGATDSGADGGSDGTTDGGADGDSGNATDGGAGDSASDTAAPCAADDCPLEGYAPAGAAGEIEAITSNLSGITYNAATGTYLAVLDSNRELHELDAELNHLRTIALSNVEHSDTEDISWLGSDGDRHEYAVVTEDSVLYVGAVPPEVTELDLSTFQQLTFAPPPASGNRGGEGVAYDPDSGTFWVCSEKDPMVVYTFARPASEADLSYEDGLSVSEAFDAPALLSHAITDIASCYYDARTGRLLMLSEESERVLDVELDGAVVHALEVPELSKPEGLTLGASAELVVVGEPNGYQVYEYAGE